MLGLVEAGVVAAAMAGGGQAMPVAAPPCRIEGPRRVHGEIDARGRVTLRPLLVRCATRGRVTVRLRPRHGGLGRLRGVRFTVPVRTPSRIRLRGRAFADPASRRSVLGRRVVVRVRARAVQRRFEVTLRRPKAAKALLGVGDQAPGMFEDPLFAPLQVPIARLVVPWDAMTGPDVAGWLEAARREGVEPLVAFGLGRGDRCPDAPCRLPSVRAYTVRFRAFRRSFPWVRAITAWNEPNHISQPTAGAPGRAARYLEAVRAACLPCRVVAGDLLDSPDMGRYLARYRRALTRAPQVWGLHNYFDTTYGGTAGLRTMLGRVTGRIWLTETGGIVTNRRTSGRVGLPYDEARAARGVRRAIAMADASPRRVTRVYLYQWRGGHDRFDAGLLGPDGAPRPGYRVLRRALRGRAEAPLVNGRPGPP